MADRRKQREKIKPKDATSPTFLTEAAMLISTIDALEGIDATVVEISGAYLSADMYNKVHAVFRGTLA